jgi:putative SOS response-associated peptidase YedK
MCGRFTLTADIVALQTAFPWLDIPHTIDTRYNIAPSQPVAVVPNDGRNQVNYFLWGLIPSWAKDPSIGNRMINARSETLSQKPSFRSAFQRRRCLILADGFFEWQSTAGKSKIPYYIQLSKKQPFAFAGLWDRWQSPDGSEILSCTIITTRPNQLISKIHNRMPVILPTDAYTHWLDASNQDTSQLTQWLEPLPQENFIANQVTQMVNNPKIDSPECIQPIAP